MVGQTKFYFKYRRRFAQIGKPAGGLRHGGRPGGSMPALNKIIGKKIMTPQGWTRHNAAKWILLKYLNPPRGISGAFSGQ